MGEFKYKAFISYSHKDKQSARWLHRRLETYAFPKHAIGKLTDSGPVPKNLKPIFRDRDELAAADDLGKKIESALSQSENLIVICSPAAAASHWVNQEVLYFKKHNRGAKIFSVIVEGEPFAAGMSGQATQECLPPALRFQINEAGELTDTPAEPLAADLRPHGDGKRLGLLKLISGMAGLGLDDLVQRDLQRARRRVTAITVSAIAAMLIMGSLSWFALDARQEAEARRAEAEARTESAEKLIEFMVTDLKEKLEPVGRLDALKVVGEQASQYYDQYPLSAHDDDALGRRARVFHFLGELQRTQGNSESAANYFRRAHKSTAELLARNSDNPDRVFEHAQSAFYVGNLLWENEKFDSARPYFDEYINCAEILKTLEPLSLRSKQEITYAYSNLGTLLFKQGKVQEAYALYLRALPAYRSIANNERATDQDLLDLADAYGWLADVAQYIEGLEASENYREESWRIYEKLITRDPNNFRILSQSVSAFVALARVKIMQGKLDDAITLSDEGLKKATEYYKYDQSNVGWAIPLISLKLQKAEIYLLQDQTSKANFYLDDVKSMYDSLGSVSETYSGRLQSLQFSQKYLNVCLQVAKNEHNQAIKSLTFEDAFETQGSFIGSDLANPYIPFELLKVSILQDFDDLSVLASEINSSPESIHPKFVSNLESFQTLFPNRLKDIGQLEYLFSNGGYYEHDLFNKTIQKIYRDNSE